MGLKDYIDVAFQQTDKISTLWQFYVAFVAILFGWVLTVKNHVLERIPVKLLILAGLLVFETFNLQGLLTTYENLILTRNEVWRLASVQGAATPSDFLRTFQSSVWLERGIYFTWLAHGLVAVALLVLLFPRTFIPRFRAARENA